MHCVCADAELVCKALLHEQHVCLREAPQTLAFDATEQREVDRAQYTGRAAGESDRRRSREWSEGLSVGAEDGRGSRLAIRGRRGERAHQRAGVRRTEARGYSFDSRYAFT